VYYDRHEDLSLEYYDYNTGSYEDENFGSVIYLGCYPDDYNIVNGYDYPFTIFIPENYPYIAFIKLFINNSQNTYIHSSIEIDIKNCYEKQIDKKYLPK